MSTKRIIVGIDEAGRGPLAGPVIAGACVDYQNFPSHLIRDSKQLSEENREKAFLWITEHCTYGVGVAAAEEIDRIGILEATQKAMQEALARVAETVTPTYILVDGRDQFWFDYAHSSIIGGDRKEPCISAASIIAKVTRDRWMVEVAHQKFPQYNFAKHKGYGTPEHLAALEKYGPCPLHRRTFLKIPSPRGEREFFPPTTHFFRPFIAASRV
jgi:ribonuclease HII